jgi:tetratricopeptide (TPR) repeat protein
VEELVRMLIDQGVVVQREGRWVATGDAHLVAVPETVEAIIRARLDTLPRPERALLQVASVVGRTFERSAVAVLVGDGDPVDLLLEEAVLRDLVTEEVEPEPSYRFKHILIRDVAYASLPKARRADLHARVAAWLLDWGAGRADEVTDIRAYHLEQSVLLQAELDGRVDETRRKEAIEALAASADRALGREDFLAAESFATRALDLPGATSPPSLDLRWRLIEAVRGRRDIVRTGELADALAADARAAGRPEMEGRALYAGIEAIWLGVGQGTELVRQRLDRSVELLTAAGDVRHLFEAEFWRGFIGWWLGDLAAASERWQRAEAIARELGDRGREGLVVARLAAAARNSGDVRRALELHERSLALAAQGRSRYALAHATVGYANTVAIVSSVPRALERIDEALRLYEDLGDREGIGEANWAIGQYANLTGEPEKAIAPLQRAIALYEEIRHVGFLPEVERELAEALLALGNVEEAESHALRAREVVAPDDWSTVASTSMVLGRVRAVQGRDGEAEGLLREAVSITAGTDYLANQAESAVHLAVFLLSRGRDEGHTWADRARSIAQPFGSDSPIMAAIERWLAPYH